MSRGGPGDEGSSDEALVDAALALLDDLSTGRYTKPCRRLYPHQWSWDAAFIAIGRARVDQSGAEDELRALFSGQWANGMVPHIVFDPDSKEAYFPGPDFWETWRSSDAPNRPLTSGIAQPPIHSTAVRHIYEHGSDRAAALSFVSEMVPRLASWHEYLRRERRRRTALTEIWHPWESGMDNSPLWDHALNRLFPGDSPGYRRSDLTVAHPEERPTDYEYDRYVYLVDKMRRVSYRGDLIRAGTPFAILDVLWNTLLVQANRDLAFLCEVVSTDPGGLELWADAITEEMESRMWDAGAGLYGNVDVIDGRRRIEPVSAAFAPLFAGIPDPDRAAKLVETMVGLAVQTAGGLLVPSYEIGRPEFSPRRYWRGPVWLNVNWLIYRGLLRYGFTDLAARVRQGILGLVRRSGFMEHYHPLTGEGCGAEDFAWSAALVIELVREDEGAL